MATNLGDAYVQILVVNLQRVLDFLKFAEAKNAGLLALASAWTGAMLSLECSGRTLPGLFTVSVPLALLCALCAALIAMVSFMPLLHLPSFLGGKHAGPHAPNLLFFADISAVTVKTLEQELPARYRPEGEGPRDEYIRDLTVQIQVNSVITMRKMKLFRAGMTLILLAAISLLLPAFGLAFRAIRGIW